jgi:hypothetical protein
MPRKETASEPEMLAGDVCPEFHADFAKLDVMAGGVKIWAYSDQHDPVADTTSRIRAVILALPIPAFDMFLADCLRIRAKLLHMNGDSEPRTLRSLE